MSSFILEVVTLQFGLPQFGLHRFDDRLAVHDRQVTIGGGYGTASQDSFHKTCYFFFARSRT